MGLEDAAREAYAKRQADRAAYLEKVREVCYRSVGDTYPGYDDWVVDPLTRYMYDRDERGWFNFIVFERECSCGRFHRLGVYDFGPDNHVVDVDTTASAETLAFQRRASVHERVGRWLSEWRPCWRVCWFGGVFK